jgi:hypothetical protein
MAHPVLPIRSVQIQDQLPERALFLPQLLSQHLKHGTVFTIVITAMIIHWGEDLDIGISLLDVPLVMNGVPLLVLLE